MSQKTNVKREIRDFSEFMVKYNLWDKATQVKLSKLAFKAFQEETEQLNECYLDYVENYSPEDGPLLDRDQFHRDYFEYSAGSWQEEKAYNFLEIIREIQK